MQIIMSYVKGGSGYHFRYKDSQQEIRYLKLQVETSLKIGYSPIIATNFPFKHCGIEAIQTPILNTWSAFSNKLPILNWLIKEGYVTDDILYKDVDVYTFAKHDFPTQKDVGMALHSVPGRWKYQGGVQYYRKSAYDIIEKLADTITNRKVKKEEQFMPKFYKDNYPNRIETLDYRYNLFRQGEFSRKWPLATKPIINCHFKFDEGYESCVRCFVEGKNKYEVKVLPDWIKRIAIKHGLYKE